MSVSLQPGGDSLGPAAGCGAEAAHEEGCITCGDVAEPLRVVSVDRERVLALCENDHGARETVEVALVGDVATGDELLVHAGTAIAHLAEAAGPRTPGSEAEDVRDVSADPLLHASPQGEARGDAVFGRSA